MHFVKSTSGFTSNLKALDWKLIYKKIFKLQSRIVKQLKKNKIRKVRNLQRLILKSFSAQLVASQKLIELKNYKNFQLYKKKIKNIYLDALCLTKYIKLMEEDFSNFKNRKIKNHLSLYQKFLNLLWVITLLPINESISNSFSYNYRLYRDQMDLLKEISLTLGHARFNWILIIKPSGFFKDKNKLWLVNNSFIEKKFLFFLFNYKEFANQELNHYYKYNTNLSQINQISLKKILKNFSLQIKFLFKNEEKLTTSPIFFYNDLILVPNLSLNKLKKIYQLLFLELQERGLYIKKNRIWVVNLVYGFNFLGWFLIKKNGKINIQISRENVKSHQLDIKNSLNSMLFSPIDKTILKLNHKIINWQSYYAYSSNLFETWSEMNYYLFWRIWRWCKKRHKNKGSKWLYERYWSKNKKGKWVFNFNNRYLKSYSITKKKIIHLSSKINACEISNLTKVKEFLLQKYLK